MGRAIYISSTLFKYQKTGKMIESIKIGADMEVFLQHAQSGEILSAEGHVFGTKQVPFIMDSSEPGYTCSLDNVLAEFNIPPAIGPYLFSSYIDKGLKLLSSHVSKIFKLSIQASAYLPPKELETENAKLFGCEKDYNAWLEIENEAPVPDGNLRTAGAHVHVGYRIPDPFESVSLVQSMDLFLGVPSVLMDEDTDRKKLYGKAGAHRLKPYGVEYRVLSNFWIKSERLRMWVYSNTMMAAKFTNEGDVFLISNAVKEDIIDCINNSDKEKAQKLITHFNIPIV
jgi:hypothetical protein